MHSSRYLFDIYLAFAVWFPEFTEEPGAKVENLDDAEDWEACQEPHGAANQANPLQKKLRGSSEFYHFKMI